MMWRSLLLALTAFLAASAPVAGLQPTKGPLAFVLHVNITNQTASLNGSYAEQRISMTGEVRVDVVLIAVKVTLSSSTDTYWATDVSPRDMVFNSSGVQSFIADVTIPASTFNFTANLTVKGNATVSGLPTDTSSDTATIVVNGPIEGSGPDIPGAQPPNGQGAPAALPNMPAFTLAVSAGMVFVTAAALWMWKARRLSRSEKAERKRPRGVG